MIVHDTYEGVPSSILYWQMPVNVDGDVRHARVALFGDVEGPRREVRETPATTSFAQRFGMALENLFAGEAPRDAVRAQVDLELIDLASQIIDAMVTTGGPARAAESAEAGAG